VAVGGADGARLVLTTGSVACHERGCVKQVEVDTLVVRRQKALVGSRSKGRGLRGVARSGVREESVVGLGPL